MEMKKAAQKLCEAAEKIGVIAVLTLCGGSLRDSAFAAFACVSNSGLDSSISPNGGLYTSVSDGGKWILSLMMLTGRLEIFTVLLIFTPRFWKR